MKEMREPIKRYTRKRYFVDVQEPVETLDDLGQPVVTWQTVFIQEPAEYAPMSGFEYVRGRQYEAGTTALFRVNYREGYTRQMRLVFNDEYYGITHINPVDGRFRELDLTTKATPQ